MKLVTKRLVLREPTMKDAKNYYDYANSKEYYGYNFRVVI